MLKGHGGFGGDFYVAVLRFFEKKGVWGWGKDQKDMMIPQRFEEDVSLSYSLQPVSVKFNPIARISVAWVNKNGR
ncbi:hypothetical protein CDAR_211761 [Caerostris darwini]|uniref:Uncharacterized protein n=1 Tax=Caerostris darwini TaxID=1538125 RepID=A0AAV4PE01_9ARAC|nr:hypothetical protein CDAR_211761 [Caerostris darwini]